MPTFLAAAYAVQPLSTSFMAFDTASDCLPDIKPRGVVYGYEFKLLVVNHPLLNFCRRAVAIIELCCAVSGAVSVLHVADEIHVP